VLRDDQIDHQGRSYEKSSRNEHDLGFSVGRDSSIGGGLVQQQSFES